MKRKSRNTVFLAAALLVCSCIAPARNLLVGTPDEAIRRRASRAPAPLWQLPLGPALVEEMQILGPDRLLVGLIKDFPGLPSLDYFLLDSSRGELIWRHPRSTDSGRYDIVLALDDLLLFRIEKGRTASLLALDPRTGGQLWASRQEAGGLIHIPVPAASRVVVVDRNENRLNLKALSIKDGSVMWETVRPSGNARLLHPPLVDGEDILFLDPGVARLSSLDGKVLYALPGLSIDETCPPPQLDGRDLWLIDSKRHLILLNAAGGDILWTAELAAGARYTNIYPLDRKVYVRGIGDGGEAKLFSIRRDSGALDWIYTGEEQSISNLIESDGLLYLATPATLVALDAKSGRPVFSSPLNTSGRAFPVHIRKIQNRIIYIGELVVAAFDSTNGALIYRHGMTPISPECHLDGLDASIPRFKEAFQETSGKPAGNLRDLSRFATSEMVRYQNLANTYRSQASAAAGRGDSIGSDIASLKSSFARHESKLQANAAFAYALMDLGLAVRSAFEAAAIKTTIERQELFRKSILKSYYQAESEAHVYRPHLEWAGAGDSFTTLSVVHLPTGKRRDTYLSPEYMSYGLWNLIDFERGVVFHHGIGMNPALYQLSEARRLYPYDSARTFNTFLIAVPVAIPR